MLSVEVSGMSNSAGFSPFSSVSRRTFLASGAALAAAALPAGKGFTAGAADVKAPSAKAPDERERDRIRAEQDRPRKISDRARQLIKDTVTINVIQPPNYTEEMIKRFRSMGYGVVSVTIDPSADCIAVIGKLLRFVDENSGEYQFVRNWDDVVRARASNRLAVGINSQNSTMLDGNLDLVHFYRSLGLMSMNLAYNVRNAAADGCAEAEDNGLSRFGRSLVKEMRKAGILCDGSHSGRRSTLEAMDLYDGPFVFTHSNCRAVFDHYRNIGDDQIKACAATGGVVGINGVGRFLFDPYAGSKAMFAHIDHVVSLVGWQHVGIGLDWVRDVDRQYQALLEDRGGWPDNNGLPVQYATFSPPEAIGEVVDLMLARGYTEQAIKGFLGENFQRVLRAVWGAPVA